MSIDIANILDTVQTFVDDSRIVASQGMVRRFHSAVRHSTEPVLAKTLDCEANCICLATVLPDLRDGGYRMWYGCLHIDGTSSQHYAVSPDGLTCPGPWCFPDMNNPGRPVKQNEQWEISYG